MKKTYICPEVTIVGLNTAYSLLSLSGRESGTMNINEGTTSSVWSHEDKGWDIWDDDELN